ncbi:MAG: DUF748 domain-containing protein [Magnetococcales bacterium]|nr:DUF748 domain-containing protein [Magnetococcales bacterium]
MLNRRSFLLIGILLIVVIGSAALIHYQTKNLDKYRPWIVETLERVTNHSIVLKKVEYAPLSGLFTLQLNTLEILAQDPTEPPMLQVRETLLSFSPLSLITGKPKLSAIKFIDPQFNLVLRDHAPLMERAQDTALASDASLLKELGLGLAELTIGRISIQNGILAILDWDHHEGRTWVFDHLQVGIHALSPTRASPVTASARYRSIPFTVNGQVGPLPETLDPFEMPILLSLEAKSVGLKDMEGILSTETIRIRTSRGYLTTLLHGSLLKGLQTTTWLQLDGVTLSRTDETNQEEKSPPVKQSLLDRFSQRNEKKSLDLALRQKSTLHMGWGVIPSLAFQEFFIYLDGTPVLETSGSIQGRWRGPLKLDIKTLNSVNLDRFPWPSSFPLQGNSPTGSFQLSGIWPTTISYTADLDLTQTTIDLPPLQKGANTPLALHFLISQIRNEIAIKELEFKHPIVPDHFVKITGSLTPSLKVTTVANWNMGNLADYLPMTKEWSAKGMALLSVSLRRELTEEGPWYAEGELESDQGHLGRFQFNALRVPFELKNNQLQIFNMGMESAGGRIELLALADLTQDPVLFDSRLSIAGTDLASLTTQWEGNEALRLEGYLFAHGSLQGRIDQQTFLPTENLSGHARLRIEPGRLAGIDQALFFQEPTQETTISDNRKSLYWNQMKVDLNLLDGVMTLDTIQVNSGETQLRGKGVWESSGTHHFDLSVSTDPLNPKQPKQQFSVNIEGDGITNGFRMKPRPAL